MKLLHVDSSIQGEGSVSRRLSAAVVERWRARHPHLEVTYRDLATAPLPHLDGVLLAAGERAGSEALEEFLAADVVVVGAPMYNFGVPSQLKAWIDRLAVAGRTFRYTSAGPEGLAGGKKVIVASSRGGLYGAGTPQAASDFQEPYLKAVFGFFGIDDVGFVRAEGVALGEQARRDAIERALAGLPAPAEAA